MTSHRHQPTIKIFSKPRVLTPLHLPLPSFTIFSHPSHHDGLSAMSRAPLSLLSMCHDLLLPNAACAPLATNLFRASPFFFGGLLPLLHLVLASTIFYHPAAALLTFLSGLLPRYLLLLPLRLSQPQLPPQILHLALHIKPAHPQSPIFLTGFSHPGSVGRQPIEKTSVVHPLLGGQHQGTFQTGNGEASAYP